MNQKQAKKIRQFIRAVSPGIDTRTVRYRNAPNQNRQLIVDPRCFRGMYLQAKQAVQEENYNV
jgi:hypothetical protein